MDSLDQILSLECIEAINKEQRRQIEIHKWIQSEKCGRDLADEAVLEWIEKYAPLFRKWAKTLPFTCVNCGSCPGPKSNGMCTRPFDEERLKFIESNR